MNEKDNSLLRVDALKMYFPVTKGPFGVHAGTVKAVDNVSFSIEKGKTFGLVGESGCGKSTFMRFLVSLDTPSEGEILYRGKDITKLKGEELRQNRQNIQMVFQDPTSSFNPKMKIRDIVCEPLLNFNRIKKSEKDAEAGGRLHPSHFS